MAEVEPADGESGEENGDVPAWRQRAVSRSLNAARSRAEKRAQRFLDAAFELMDEKGTTDFTIQEVIDRSKQSLRGFYQYFNGKDELLLALFEESVRESIEDQRAVIEGETDPLERLHAFVIRLHEWCDPTDAPRRRGQHNRRPISEFMVQLAASHPERVRTAIAPTADLLADLLDDAHKAGVIDISDTRRIAALVMRTVMYSWFGNRLAPSARQRISAEETWQFCLNGLHAD
jgi:AcrR family transcriptional regulator